MISSLAKPVGCVPVPPCRCVAALDGGRRRVHRLPSVQTARAGRTRCPSGELPPPSLSHDGTLHTSTQTVFTVDKQKVDLEKMVWSGNVSFFCRFHNEWRHIIQFNTFSATLSEYSNDVDEPKFHICHYIPNYFLWTLSSRLLVNSSLRPRSTRQDADLSLPRVRTEAGRRRRLLFGIVRQTTACRRKWGTEEHVAGRGGRG